MRVSIAARDHASLIAAGGQDDYNSCVLESWPHRSEQTMPQMVNVNPTSEHSTYLRLFVTNSGGL
ncbi:MAG TPA: hypothetical protein VH592_08865 [Gemmataceae bacterium]|jgi:hypothetical protein